ncbi:uncharacterized protein KY384_005517 [Bacidia gigantensis]|uniref:uncharacterized protein n=1 Tax=Bacidia gigantensis TaxID=2732470 RepID=UPI001D036A9A|nr:uncharacterized protein KY384_005517 [Bacidia gigantensis]KAG8530035.1 hypothetical protein KY384_005517 [Bacidia gigantensis]
MGSQTSKKNQPEEVHSNEDDDELDEWDKRIFSTGCSREQTKMNDCYFDKKDWRACKGELHRLPSPPSQSQAAFATLQPATTRRDVPRSYRHSEARRSLATTRVSHQQQAAVINSNKNPLHPQPLQNPEPIKPQAENLSEGLNDRTLDLNDQGSQVDWTRSFQGLSTEAFSPEAAKTLLAPINSDDVEIKMDGIIYLPEIKYRRILNKAFGPGGWGLAPRGETIVTQKAVTREYALVVLGRLVSIARGEQDYFSPEGIPRAVEGCKSTALRRCCKDLGIASELWDPRFIRKFMAEHAKEVFAEHMISKKRRKIYLRKDEKVGYPYTEAK